MLPEPVFHVFPGRQDRVRVEPQFVRVQLGPVSVQLQHAAVPAGLRRRTAAAAATAAAGVVTAVVEADAVAARTRARHQGGGRARIGDDVLGERLRRGLRHGDRGHVRLRRRAPRGRRPRRRRAQTRRTSAAAAAAGAVHHDPAVHAAPRRSPLSGHAAAAVGRGGAAARKESGELEEREPAQRQDGVPVLADVLRARHRLGQHIRRDQFGLLRGQNAHGQKAEAETRGAAAAVRRRRRVVVLHVAAVAARRAGQGGQ